jgi:hypothetical protein
MVLLKGMHRLDPQCLAASFKEAKCTRLGYGIRLSRLHTLDSPLALAFPRSSHLATIDSEQENNQETPISCRYLKQTRL